MSPFAEILHPLNLAVGSVEQSPSVGQPEHTGIAESVGGEEAEVGPEPRVTSAIGSCEVDLMTGFVVGFVVGFALEVHSSLISSSKPRPTIVSILALTASIETELALAIESREGAPEAI